MVTISLFIFFPFFSTLKSPIFSYLIRIKIKNYILVFYYMFEIIKNSYKKEIQDNIFIKLENIFNFIFRDKDLSFWIFSLLHYNSLLLFFLFIFVVPKNSNYLKFIIFFWVIYSWIHFYFSGSFFTRFEKYISKNKNWSGIYEILPLLNIPKTKENIRKTFFIVSAMIYYSIIFKIYF